MPEYNNTPFPLPCHSAFTSILLICIQAQWHIYTLWYSRRRYVSSCFHTVVFTPDANCTTFSSRYVAHCSHLWTGLWGQVYSDLRLGPGCERMLSESWQRQEETEWITEGTVTLRRQPLSNLQLTQQSWSQKSPVTEIWIHNEQTSHCEYRDKDGEMNELSHVTWT